VLDNALLGLRFSRARRRRVAEPRAEARRLLAALELPEALLHRPVTELSVGQQQRVAAVRALAGAPGLVIADEPTSALDTTVRQRFLELLFRECEHAGTTLVFVSHDPTLSGLFHRVVDLADLNRAAP
jgi:putative ABC transport system ATP-binding protein